MTEKPRFRNLEVREPGRAFMGPKRWREWEIRNLELQGVQLVHSVEPPGS